MKINWNYLIGSEDKIDKNYVIENRPDPDNACKKLSDDVIEVYLSHGFGFGSKIKIENEANQYKCNSKSDWEKKWGNYEKVNNDVKFRDNNLLPPFYTIKVNEIPKGNEWLLSVDYIGPSIYWALRELEVGGLCKTDIIDILNVCRTIGGHIVWPRGSRLTYKINTSRGGADSVYDRIDWTLYLLQLCYENEFDIIKINENILKKYPKEIFYKTSQLVKAICESKSWFDKIGSFARFCNQFILKGAFVDENYEVKWFAKMFPIFPEDYKQFSINNMNAVKQRNLNILIDRYGSIIDELFTNGGELYTFDDLKVAFSMKCKDNEYDDALNDCILQGWITDCGNGYYTR